MPTTRRNNRVVLDLKKVAYAWHFWRNQWGDTRQLKPKHDTAHDTPLLDTYAWPYEHDYPHETHVERARRLDLLDKWKPVIRLRMSAADVLEFTGGRAQILWKAWCEKQFNPRKK